MPPKRKRSQVDADQEPPRIRRTRSFAAVRENGLQSSQQSTPSSTPQRTGSFNPSSDNSRTKAPNGDNDDELLLSPSKPRFPRLATTPRTGKPRYFLDAVEITVSPRRCKRPILREDSPYSSLSELTSSSSKLSMPRPKQTAKRKPFPVKQHVTPRSSPSPISRPSSPTRLYSQLPSHLHACLNAQKRAILRALQKPPDLCQKAEEGVDDQEPETNAIAFKQLTELLNGTVTRDEGNSCLLLGPRGSGKSRVSWK
jgi:origin recognition complex subunit 4